MYADSAYWNNQLQDFTTDEYPLFVGSCGVFQLFTQPELPTYHKNRIDYQILYIASGKAHFYFDGVEETVSAGNMIIYRPHEEQHYYYYGADHTEAYWVHFTGYAAEEMLEQYGITKDIRMIHIGASLEYKQIFLRMIRELKLRKDDYEELLSNYLQQLFIHMHRVVKHQPNRTRSLLLEEMDIAVRFFHENYNKPINIEDFAASRHMSVSWFIRNFKKHTDLTPTQYILSLRISNAQALLQTTDYNISEIAEIVGYDNPLYFSRIFKKQVGMSPSDFRK